MNDKSHWKVAPVCCYGGQVDLDRFGGRKRMKRLVFAPIAIVAIALSACGGNNEDTLQNVEMNQPSVEQLDEHANQAALDAANAEAAALGNMQQQARDQNASADEPTNPTDEDEQNVSGM